MTSLSTILVKLLPLPCLYRSFSHLGIWLTASICYMTNRIIWRGYRLWIWRLQVLLIVPGSIPPGFICFLDNNIIWFGGNFQLFSLPRWYPVQDEFKSHGVASPVPELQPQDSWLGVMNRKPLPKVHYHQINTENARERYCWCIITSQCLLTSWTRCEEVEVWIFFKRRLCGKLSPLLASRLVGRQTLSKFTCT